MSRARLLLAAGVSAAACGFATLEIEPVARRVGRAQPWTSAVDPIDLTVLSMTVIVIFLSAWTAVVSAAALLVSFGAPGSESRLLDRFAPRPLQRWVQGMAALSLTAGLAAPAPGAELLPEPPPERTAEEMPGTATMTPLDPVVAEPRPLDEAPSSTVTPLRPSSTTSTTDAAEVPTTVTTTVPSVEPTTTSTANPPTAAATAAPVPSTEDSPAPDPPDRSTPPAIIDTPAPEPGRPFGDAEVVVQAGDSLWSIAVDELDPASSEREVTSYWLRLIEANRDRLVVRDDPDLIYPGQVLVLPRARD